MDAASITGRIADWLQGVGGSDLKIEQVNSSSSQQYCPGQCLTRNRKRKFDSLMDETSLRNKSVIDSGINLPPSSIADLSNADFSQEDFEATASQTRSTSPSKRTRSESPSKRSRSASPSKRPKFQLKFSLPTINFKAEEDFSCIENLPLGNPLIAALFEAENQIPADLQSFLQPQTKRTLGNKLSFSKEAKYNGHKEKFESVVSGIVKRSIRAIDKERNEDDWSDNVVHPILRFAEELLNREDTVEVVNVKTVNVQPAELLPTNARGRPNQKRVDYTFSVELPDEGKTFSLMKSMMIKQDVDIWSLCQTDYPSLASRSLFAHLEIKRRFAGTDGEIQMGIWSAAGFRKLHSLLIERNRAVTNAWSKLPVMPMWLVEGETWKLYVSSQQFAERVIVYGPFILWKTTSAQSVVGLILSLVAVMDWGIQHYLPWFLETIAYNQI